MALLAAYTNGRAGPAAEVLFILGGILFVAFRSFPTEKVPELRMPVPRAGRFNFRVSILKKEHWLNLDRDWPKVNVDETRF